MKKVFYLLIAMATIMTACKKKQTDQHNPFFEEWGGEFGLPPFAKITDADYRPAIIEGIKQHEAEIKAIIDNQEEPTFANTIEAYDHSGQLLDKVMNVIFNLNSSDSNDSLKAIVEFALPMLSEHKDNTFMNPDFFKRVETVYKNQEKENLTTEQKMVLDKIYKQFTRNGIALPDDKQERLRQVNKELGLLQQKFGNNLLAETNAFSLVIDNKEDLAGLPESAIEAAADEAKATGKEGKWVFTLKNPSYVPFMQYADKRELREKMFRAYSMRGNNGNEYDNKQIILDIMKLRIEKANILGYNTPADFFLENSLAKTPDNVNKLLNSIMPAAIKKAKDEAKELQKIIDSEKGGFKLQPWDWSYYAEKLRKDKYALNEDEINQYFQMENVRQGVFELASRLYKINFEPLKDASIYHEDVEAFKVTNQADGSLVGIFYTDYYPRQSKRGGAWMNNFREQEVINGKDIRPIVVNVGNFTKPTSSKPSLLTTDEVETLFHEFGHGLHGLLSKCNYRMINGTNTPRDFVEMPSQITENWAFQPEVLKTYAKHYKTGEIIPDSLVQKINNTAMFNQGFMTAELVAAAILDMNWHTIKSVEGIDVLAFEQQAVKNMGLIDEIIPRYRSTYFNHIFNSGYSAGYYAYLWAEMLDKDAFELFKERGIYDEATAKSFKENILERGSSDDLMVLYKKFRGQEPSITPMLRDRGLIK
ncbi:MAG: M3 family metallopeptidase [Porphyromonadaceae bacterium]|nr:M3 family metallopeptidase [Porphyromonadaceae bacterium]